MIIDVILTLIIYILKKVSFINDFKIFVTRWFHISMLILVHLLMLWVCRSLHKSISESVGNLTNYYNACTYMKMAYECTYTCERMGYIYILVHIYLYNSWLTQSLQIIDEEPLMLCVTFIHQLDA